MTLGPRGGVEVFLILDTPALEGGDFCVWQSSRYILLVSASRLGRVTNRGRRNLCDRSRKKGELVVYTSEVTVVLVVSLTVCISLSPR